MSRNKLEEFKEGSYLTDIAVKMARIETGMAARYLRDMYIQNDPSTYEHYVALIEENLNSLHEGVDFLKATSVENKEQIEQLKVVVGEWENVATQALNLILEGKDALSYELIIEECPRLLNQVDSIAAEIDEAIAIEQEDILNSSVKITQLIIIIVSSLLVISIILSIIISRRITQSIVNPLEELEEAALQMSKGNIQVEIKYDGDDAVGKLAESMRNCMITLNTYIS